MINGNRFPPKDPAEKLDFVFDWAAEKNNSGLTNWLQDDEIITGHSVTVPDGLTLESTEQINDNTAILVWLSGGTDGTDYPVSCQIETATRIGVRTAILPVQNQ